MQRARITFKSNDRFGGFEAVIEQPEGVKTDGETDAFCVDELILTVTQKRKRDEDLLLCMVQIPELFPGAGPLKCRESVWQRIMLCHWVLFTTF
jgi:hypothetical protein